VKQIGRELGVRYVLEGSVRRGGDKVRVNVQLIDSESGAHVWADRFETDRRNLAEAQREITGRSSEMSAAASSRIMPLFRMREISSCAAGPAITARDP